MTNDAAAATQRVIDQLAAAVDSNRLRVTLGEALTEPPFSQIQEWAESLTSVAEAIEEAENAMADWVNSEDREVKAQAKEWAMEAITTLVDAWNGSPLDLTQLHEWTPDDE